MKKPFLALTASVIGAALLALAGCSCVTPAPAPPAPLCYAWGVTLAGHWTFTVSYPRCPGCPPLTNYYFAAPIYGWYRTPCPPTNAPLRTYRAWSDLDVPTGQFAR